MAGINELIYSIADVLAAEKAQDLPEVCSRYGLEGGEESEAFKSKRVYVRKRLKGKDQLFLIDLSKRIINDYGTDANDIVKMIYKLDPIGFYSISELTRRNIMEELYAKGNISGKLDLIGFLSRIWNLDSMPSTDEIYSSAHNDIWQHMINNDDWDEVYLFESYLELIITPDDLFIKFLEEVVNPIVRPIEEQKEYIKILNQHLQNDGYQFSINSLTSNYPIYKINKIHGGVKGTFKNLIFASIGAKPEIVFNDSINNDISIIKNADECLVFDIPVTNEGLKWRHLLEWWQSNNPHISPEDIEGNLYRRLLKSLSSEAEKNFFYNYFSLFRDKLKQNFPALVPQVYLHYDPYTLKQRNNIGVLPRQRMDFLFLLSNNQRIVIEVDGKQHYSIGDKASPKRYADMVFADRDLKLNGYDVYRFGGYELMDKKISSSLLNDFFERLFKKYEVI